MNSKRNELLAQLTKLCSWKHLMSYNEAYFGEPEGELKAAVYAIERCLPEALAAPADDVELETVSAHRSRAVTERGRFEYALKAVAPHLYERIRAEAYSRPATENDHNDFATWVATLAAPAEGGQPVASVDDTDPLDEITPALCAAERALIDSAGGAKGDAKPDPSMCTHKFTLLVDGRRCYVCGWDFRNGEPPQPAEDVRSELDKHEDAQRQPCECDGAVDDTVNILGNVAFADDWFAQFMVEGVTFLAPLDNKEQARHILAAKKRRPAATAQVPEGFVQRVRNDLAGWIDTYGEGHIDTENLIAECDAMLAAAPAAPKGGVVVTPEMAQAFIAAHDESASHRIAKIFAAGQRRELDVIVGLRTALATTPTGQGEG